jgi:MipA family protein
MKFGYLFAAAALLASPALAQEAGAPVAPSAPTGDQLTIGVGIAYAPTYEGSDDYSIAPAAIVRGQVSGFNFFSRATAGYFDLAREAPGSTTDFLIGPMVNFRFDRSRDIKDPVVEAVGELDLAVELGAFIGFGRNGLLNPYDYAQARLDFVHDVSGTHDGYVLTPTLEYGTPLSRKTYAGVALSADYASGEFADTYYSVDGPASIRSGLPAFDADDGFKNIRFTLLGNHMVTGDLIEGGVSLFAVGSYSRMFGDFKRSPLVDGFGAFDGRGDADQWFGALGIAYTF